MRITLLLCMLAVLTGCPRDQSDAQQRRPNDQSNPPGQLKKKQEGMDSPIIVSDGSTHLRHQTFQTDNSGKRYIQDPGYYAFTLTCTNNASGCMPSGTPILLVAPPHHSWTLDVLDADGATKIVTLTSGDNNKIDIDFHKHPTHEQPDHHPGTTGDIDIIQDDFVFQTAKLMNGDGKPYTITCTDSSSGSCELHIDYCSPMGQCK